MLKIETGRIIKSLSGFYDVQTGKKVITCRARGSMRRSGMSPLVGDMVDISVEKGKGMVVLRTEQRLLWRIFFTTFPQEENS